MTLKTLKTGALVAVAMAGALAAATPASAQYRYGHNGYYRGGGFNPGAAAAVGIIGGLALGAAIAAPRPAYGYGYPPPAYGYAPRRVYVAPPPVYVEPEPECFIRRQRTWVPGWGWQVRRVRVCDDY